MWVRIPPSPPTKGISSGWCLFCGKDGADENRAAVRRPQAISPAGCCLARGRISTISANKRHQLRLVPFLRLDGADENRAAVRRPQAISPAGCCLAHGRISTISANKRHQLRLVPFLRLDGADENRAAVRRPQATSPAGCCLVRGRISTISARSRRLHFETGGNILILDRFQYYSTF